MSEQMTAADHSALVKRIAAGKGSDEDRLRLKLIMLRFDFADAKAALDAAQKKASDLRARIETTERELSYQTITPAIPKTEQKI